MSIESTQDSAEPSLASTGSVAGRITEYLCNGGLCNPELMQHEKVRDLLIDCRDELSRLRLTAEERQAVREALEGYCENYDDPECNRIAWILSGLLQRTK